MLYMTAATWSSIIQSQSQQSCMKLLGWFQDNFTLLYFQYQSPYLCYDRILCNKPLRLFRSPATQEFCEASKIVSKCTERPSSSSSWGNSLDEVLIFTPLPRARFFNLTGKCIPDAPASSNQSRTKSLPVDALLGVHGRLRYWYPMYKTLLLVTHHIIYQTSINLQWVKH